MLSMQLLLIPKLGVCRRALGRRTRVSRRIAGKFVDQRMTALSGDDTSYSLTSSTACPTISAASTTAL